MPDAAEPVEPGAPAGASDGGASDDGASDDGASRSQAAAPVPAERTVASLVDWAAAALRAYGITSAVSDARELVSALYDVPRFWPVANAHQAVPDDVWQRAAAALERRLHGAPLA